MGVIAKFVWIPAHYFIVNEVADKIATQAAKGDRVGLHSSISKTEMRSTIKQKMRERWKKWCEEERTGRFYSIQRKTRREETIISRIRFGHTGLNSSLFIIGKHEMGKFSRCGISETIQHFLLHCQKYQEEIYSFSLFGMSGFWSTLQTSWWRQCTTSLFVNL